MDTAAAAATPKQQQQRQQLQPSKGNEGEKMTRWFIFGNRYLPDAVINGIGNWQLWPLVGNQFLQQLVPATSQLRCIWKSDWLRVGDSIVTNVTE